MPTNTQRRELLTTQAVADEVGVSIHTVYKWTRKGWPYFPKATRLPNGDLRVTRTDFDSWLAMLAKRGA